MKTTPRPDLRPAAGSLALALLLAFACAPAAEPPTADAEPTIDPANWPRLESPIGLDPEMEAEIDRLLAELTVREKVGQTIQPEINSVTPEEVGVYRLGSVLNGGGGWPGGNKYSTPADWVALADAFWEASMDTGESGHAIPIIWGLDAVHGHSNVIGATLFPHNIGLGATRNAELVRRIGEITAREMAVTGQDWDFSPTVAVARDDRWGRTYESYSEDPEIVRQYAGAMVEGLQGAVGGDDFLDARHVISTAKHFLGDGGTERGTDQGDNLSSEAQLRDIHAAGYLSALPAGVQAVMASYNSWHGEKMHGNRTLLTEVLKDRMGFDGLVVGDWNGHGQLPGCSPSSCAAAFNAGIDIFMVPQDWKELFENTVAQVESGEIAMERLDDAVRRILRVKMRAGLFERGKPSSRPLAGRTDVLGSPEHRAVARQAVRESMVLLKNSGRLLPLDPGSRVLVAGEGADDIGMQTGGWTITWQGTGNVNSDFPGATSIWAGIRAAVEAAGGTAILSPDGSRAADADVAIVVYGEPPYAEFQGDRDSVDFRTEGDRHLELLRRLRAADTPVVSVFLSGRPLWVNPELNASDAFVAAWLPGTEGNGIADVLFRAADGSVAFDFTGKLSFSWPKEVTQAVLNRGDAVYDPLFPYGHGLTYADDGELGELSEETAGLETLSRTVYFEGGPVSPWRLFLGDATDWRVPADTAPRVTTRGSDNLVLTAVDRNAQEDARSATWSGGALAAVFVTARDPIDLSRESNGAMALAFDAYLEEAPDGAVTLRMDCGASCSGVVDVTGLVGGLPGREWSRVAVRLRCFQEAGAEMERITVPFALASDGRLALRFSDVKLVTAEESPAGCP